MYNQATPLLRYNVIDEGVFYTPVENPSAKLLMRAEDSLAKFIIDNWYRMLPAERSQWQITAHEEKIKR